jgi:hypothetical protein
MDQDDRRPPWVAPTAVFAVIVGMIAVWIAAPDLPRVSIPDGSTTTIAALPTTSSTSSTTTTTTVASVPMEPELAPGWEDLGTLRSPYYDSVVGDTGSGLIVFGGYGGPTFDPVNTAFSTVWDGVLIDHETGDVHALPPAPLCDEGAQAGVWTGSEMIVWSPKNQRSDCSIAVAYAPDTDTWRTIDADFFREADPPVVWTGEKILSANGYSYRPDTNETGQSMIVEESPWFTGSDVSSVPTLHWTGTETLALGSKGVAEATSDQLNNGPTPPITERARTSVWTGEGLLAANYQLEAAMFNPSDETWTQLPSVPLPMWECVPQATAGDGLAFIQSCSGIAVWDGSGQWKLLPLPVLEPETFQYPYGQIVEGGGYLYLLGKRAFRYRLPDLVDGVMPLPRFVPVGGKYLDLHDDWRPSRVYVGQSDLQTPGRRTIGAEVTSPEGDGCLVEVTDRGINPYVPVFTQSAKLTRNRDGTEVPIGQTAAGVDGFAHVVISNGGTIVDVMCSGLDVARSLAAQIWSPYRLNVYPPGTQDDPTCYIEPEIGMTPGDDRLVVQLRLLNPAPCAVEGPLVLRLFTDGPQSTNATVTDNPITIDLGQTLTPDMPYLVATFKWQNWCSDPLSAGLAVGERFQAYARSLNAPCTSTVSPSTLELVDLEGPTASPALP